MLSQKLERIRSIKSFPSLVKYLRDELGWPIESEDFDDLTFDYEPEELGIDSKIAVKIKDIKQLRPLSSRQPWGIFFINFEPKRLPIVVLRRILRSLVIKKRGSAKKAHQAAWRLHDLLFISSYGEDVHREITFAHFSEPPDRLFGDLPTLRVLGWDDDDTKLKLDHVVQTLHEKLLWPEDERDTDSWRKKWTDAFVLRHREVITTSKELAVQLADLAKSIRQRANLVLNVESELGPLRKLHKAFQTALIHDLNEDDFADMYAQTIAYGLLAARVSRPVGIVADNLADMVPITNPFLKEMLGTFLSVGGRKGKIDFDELGIQDVVDLLNNPDTHMEAILRDFGKRTMQEDPVIHFYELFLKEYDKKKKVERGVFYTPQPVVSYIIRSVHELLQKEFGLEDGLASTITWGEMARLNPNIKIPEGVSPDEHFVQMLDPATGTATFLVETIEVIYQTMISKWRKEKYTEFELGDLWNEYVPKHLLPRLYGFELMMAPYAIAHMKIGLKLAETGYKFSSDERAHIYLTNSLEPPSDIAEQPEFEDWSPALAHEAKAVNEVKRGKRFMVVVGNPPYSKSMSKHPWSLELVHDFKVGVSEKKSDLTREEWKFLRFGYYNIERSFVGILGFVINNAFLSAPTHRGIRRFLLDQNAQLQIVDLHGDSRKGEASPDGSFDENVFEIQQGVCLVIGAKSLATQRTFELAKADIYGSRDHKYEHLSIHSISSTEFTRFSPEPPLFFFRHSHSRHERLYARWVPISEIFLNSNTGIQTKNDNLFTDISAQTLRHRMIDVLKNVVKNRASICEKYGLKDSAGWRVSQLDTVKFDSAAVQPFLYKPFDHRFIYYNTKALGRARYSTMQHMLRPNLGLVATRQVTRLPFCHAFVSQWPIEEKTGSHDRTTQLFPLYIYPDAQQFDFGHQQLRPHNAISPAFSSKLSELLDSTVGKHDGHSDRNSISPEQIFYYIYSILQSPSYRGCFGNELMGDFPRLPFTSSLELFKELAKLGGELVALHLMESPKLEKHITRLIGKGTPEVEKVSYSDETVWIDKATTQGFQGVPENVWNFHIGGYQVCQKWLKDRGPKRGKPGRTLSSDDINHYHRIVVAINETIRIMNEIDKVIDAHGGWPDAFLADKDKKDEYTTSSEPELKVAEQQPTYQPKTTPSTKQPTFPKKNNWKTWHALSRWAKTASVNTYWIDFASTISNKIKKGSKLSAKDQESMKKCWKQAVKNGFNP